MYLQYRRRWSGDIYTVQALDVRRHIYNTGAGGPATYLQYRRRRSSYISTVQTQEVRRCKFSIGAGGPAMRL